MAKTTDALIIGGGAIGVLAMDKWMLSVIEAGLSEYRKAKGSN